MSRNRWVEALHPRDHTSGRFALHTSVAEGHWNAGTRPDYPEDEQEAVRGYQKWDHGPLNGLLRGQSTDINPYIKMELERQTERLDRAVARDVFREDTTVYRGFKSGSLSDAAFPADLTVGEKLVDDGFMSVSTEQHVAEKFGGGRHGTVLAVRVFEGDPMLDMDHAIQVNVEHEVLLPRGAVLRIDSITPAIDPEGYAPSTPRVIHATLQGFVDYPED